MCNRRHDRRMGTRGGQHALVFLMAAFRLHGLPHRADGLAAGFTGAGCAAPPPNSAPAEKGPMAF
jgi:hypothetical protein